MKVHHLNLNTMCPLGGPFVQNKGLFNWETKYVSHSLLIETNNGLVLIDAGHSTDDMKNPQRFPWVYNLVFNPKFDLNESALYQIESLGFSKEDVRHIVPTHLDIDHAGGISDFPNATVHVFAPEYQAAMSPSNWKENSRYLFKYWQQQPTWQKYNTDGERWFGFEAARSLKGLPPEILIVPLAGHTRGHSAVAVNTDNGWLLHAGDSYFHHTQISQTSRCPIGVELYANFIAEDSKQLKINQERLKTLAAENRNDVSIFCAHDEHEFLAFSHEQNSRL